MTNNKFISLDDATALIAATGSDVTYALLGEPGIGKTAMLGELSEQLGMRAVYIDVPSTDIADIGVPMPDRETGTTSLYPNAHWGFHTGEPLVVCLDEFSKGNKMLQTMLHPLLNKVHGQRRLGATTLHPDSRVFITGNLTTDGVGDTLAAHTVNRLDMLYIRKPGSEEWCTWAIGRGLAPELVSWAYRNERLFASYVDGQLEEDDYVYNPTNAAQRGKPYVSPRSLAESSPVVAAYAEKRITYTQCDAALQGKLGVSAARDLMAHIDLGSQLPAPNEIRSSPTTCTVPHAAPAQIMCVLNALRWVPGNDDKIAADVRADLDSWFTYFARLPKEGQAMFIEAVMTAGKRAAGKVNAATKLMQVMVTHTAFKKWATENQYLF